MADTGANPALASASVPTSEALRGQDAAVESDSDPDIEEEEGDLDGPGSLLYVPPGDDDEPQVGEVD